MSFAALLEIPLELVATFPVTRRGHLRDINGPGKRGANWLMAEQWERVVRGGGKERRGSFSGRFFRKRASVAVPAGLGALRTVPATGSENAAATLASRGMSVAAAGFSGKNGTGEREARRKSDSRIGKLLAGKRRRRGN